MADSSKGIRDKEMTAKNENFCNAPDEQKVINNLDDTGSDDEPGLAEAQVKMSTDSCTKIPTYDNARQVSDKERTAKSELFSNNAHVEGQNTQSNSEDTVKHKNVRQMSNDRTCTEPSDYNRARQDYQKTTPKVMADVTCKICRKEERNVLFMPCCHIVSCQHCADHIKECVTCGKDVDSILPAYIA